MNNLPPAPQLLLTFGLSNAPDDSDSDSTSTWDDDGTSASDASDEEACSLPDEGCADEGYWEDETAADAWLARFPGGTSALYPQLFLIKPRGGKVVTLTRYPDRTDSLLHLPSEIRNRIYIHYFNGDEEVRHPKESYAPFQNRDGTAMQRILLGSENVELKFWLSTALLQTSRQLRYEAMFILFSNRHYGGVASRPPTPGRVPGQGRLRDSAVPGHMGHAKCPRRRHCRLPRDNH
jgi:hypothetical protein